MRKATVVLSVVAVAFAGRLAAHEGHAHKVMGTVAVVDATHLEIDATDGQKLSILLTPETKYLKGQTKVAAADVRVGQRVVVTVVEEGGKKRAKEVLLGTAGKTAVPAAKPSPKP